MEFTIKFISKGKGPSLSHFNVNGYDVKFKTKSNKEVLWYLNNMENILVNNLKFASVQELDSDLFKAIEYFSHSNPNMIISFFTNIKQLILIELGNLKMVKQATILGVIKYLCDMPITGKNTIEIERVFSNISYNLLFTKKILNDLFYKCDKVTKLTLNKSYLTPFGILKCLGMKYSSKSYMWALDGKTNIVFSKCDKDIDCLAETIIKTLSDVHIKVTNKIMGGLVDFTDENDLKMIEMYTKAHIKLMKKYIELIIQNNINEGKFLSIAGDVEGFHRLDIIQALSNNKDKEILVAKRTSKNWVGLRNIISKIINEYLIKQVDFRIAKNSFDTNQDFWTYYYKRSGKLKYCTFDFSQLKNCLVKREFKLYIKHLLEIDAQTKNTLREHKKKDYKLGCYTSIRASLDYFITEHYINCFADITPNMVTNYIDDLEFNGLNGRVITSAKQIETCFFSTKTFSKWICKNENGMRIINSKIDVFKSVIFSGHRYVKQEQQDTKVIPENVIKQMLENMQFIKPEIYKRLLLCSLNTPRRYEELELLNIESVTPTLVDVNKTFDKYGKQLYQIAIIEYKKQYNKEIIIKGANYKKCEKIIPVNFIVAREVEEQTKETKKLEMEINNRRSDEERIVIDKVFVVKNNTVKEGYSFIDTAIFVDVINTFIRACKITDFDGELWNFTTKQTRTTGTNLMVELGYNLDVIQKQLGHEHGNTTYESYIKVAQLHIAEGNTEFIRSEFDALFLEKDDTFDEYELLALFNKYCLDYNKIYYNRKLLGVCGLKVGEKCTKSEKNIKKNTKGELPCADCPSLYVGESCKSGWEHICEQCKNDVDVLESYFKENNISLENAFKVKEYKTAYIKYKKSQKVLEAISS